jgi:hypothetical protein
MSSYDSQSRYWYDEFAATVVVATLLLHDLVRKIPGENQQIVWLVGEQCPRMMNWKVVPTHVAAMLYWIKIDQVVENPGVDSGHIHHRASFGCRSVSGDALSGLLDLMQRSSEIIDQRLYS